jgi:hypothetical protein
MQRLVHAIRQIARHEVEQRLAVDLGVVTAVHGTGEGRTHACTVVLRDSGLVLPRVPIATQLIGGVALPRERDLVVVLFVGHDLHGPVVIGRLYSEDVEPPEHGPGEVVIALPGDETDAEKRLEVRVQTPGDGSRTATVTLEGPSVSVSCRIDDAGVEIAVQDVTLSLTQTGSADGTLRLAAGEASVSLEQGGAMTLQTSGTLRLRAGKVEISADTSVEVNGTTVSLN